MLFASHKWTRVIEHLGTVCSQQGLLLKWCRRRKKILLMPAAMTLVASARLFKIVARVPLARVPVFLSPLKALLMFIAAAVNQSCICTLHLPMNRVRRSPCNSLASANTPSTLTFRCLISSCPRRLDNLPLASSTSFWSKKRLMVRFFPEGVHRSLNWQPTQAPFSTR